MVVEGCRPRPDVVGLEAEKLARFVHAVVDLDSAWVTRTSEELYWCYSMVIKGLLSRFLEIVVCWAGVDF